MPICTAEFWIIFFDGSFVDCYSKIVAAKVTVEIFDNSPNVQGSHNEIEQSDQTPRDHKHNKGYICFVGPREMGAVV
jgi:hypothetical protein